MFLNRIVYNYEMSFVFLFVCIMHMSLMSVILTGCQEPKQALIITPKYLTKSEINLNTGEIIVKANKKELITPEIVRMLGMSPFKFLEEWIDSKLKPVGDVGEVIIEFPEFEIIETNSSQYDGMLKLSVTFKEQGAIKRKMTILSNVSKGFDRTISYANRKQVLYQVIQELIASMHDTFLLELKKS